MQVRRVSDWILLLLLIFFLTSIYFYDKLSPVVFMRIHLHLQFTFDKVLWGLVSKVIIYDVLHETANLPSGCHLSSMYSLGHKHRVSAIRPLTCIIFSFCTGKYNAVGKEEIIFSWKAELAATILVSRAGFKWSHKPLIRASKRPRDDK